MRTKLKTSAFVTCVCNRLVLFVLACSVASGMGCNHSGQLETAEVHGQVTFEGKPVTQGIIRFIPERGRSASGKIQPDGTFSLTTYSPGDGAIVGKHLVSIQSRESSQFVGVESEAPLAKSLIPEIYADEVRSGLAYEVKAGTKNEANFQLTK